MTEAAASGHVLGIDIGGQGVKGALVDLATGELTTERIRIATPQPATPEAVATVVAGIAEQVLDSGRDRGRDRGRDSLGDSPIGIAIPAVAQHGVARSAANIDKSWVDVDVDSLFTARLGRPVHVVNDADAAGVAEAHYGVARDVPGLVILTTLGTGIGSAILLDGKLMPNSELGHLEIDGYDAEQRAAQSAKKREDLSYEEWAVRLQRYYHHVEGLFWPDLFVVGGGISKSADKFLHLLDLRTPIVPAKLRNQAGIVGAALLAREFGS